MTLGVMQAPFDSSQTGLSAAQFFAALQAPDSKTWYVELEAQRMTPSCDQANNRIVYCSNNVVTYTDCANGCSVETNKCNPATAGKGECTAGAKRCNLAGEREICSAAGVWESKPCCAKGDSACILTCNSGGLAASSSSGVR